MGLATLADPELGAWVKKNVAFPNGMVDRITPATTDRERKILRDEFGVEDNWPVFGEPFKQWVLEDNFPAGRPALETVGVQFVADVSPFELMKIRILNGGHATIAYPAGLMDIHFVHEAMENPLVRGFLGKLEKDEIIPTVPPVPDTDLGDYFKLIDKRFSNPKIGDTIRRLCLDGSNRQPKFIIPTIADRLKAGKSVDGLALESALWCRYCFGTTDSGAVIEPNDPNWDRLVAASKKAKANPAAWLAMEDIYGDVGKSRCFWQGVRDGVERSLVGWHKSDVDPVYRRRHLGSTGHVASLIMEIPHRPLSGLLIFDCDGVLVDSEVISASVLAKSLTASGVPISEDLVYNRFLGRSMANAREILLTEFGLTITEELTQVMRDEMFRRFDTELKPIPGIADVLLKLTNPRCVASSSMPDRLRLTLGLTGLLEFFDPHIFSAGMVTHGKPAPDLFLHAAREMGVSHNPAL